MNEAAQPTGRVYLIGAGPGDPKLLTIKAAEAIAASDVIVYDYLVNPEVLAHSRRGAELFYAGKRAGEPSISQTHINRLLIERARRGQIVARLKGGDPFIFGRGGEEAEALVEAGIEWEVIPGVSSGVAAAAYAGIPLTHRDYASSVAFITGHDARGGKRAVDWSLASKTADTLVVFMCAETISNIARELIANGRAPSTPIALVRSATYQYQEVYSGTLEDLIAIDEDGEGRWAIGPPAIAIIGEVAALAAKLSWFGSSELRYSLRSLLPLAAAAFNDRLEKTMTQVVSDILSPAVPRYFDRIEAAAYLLENASPDEILRWVFDEFQDNVTLATGFGLEGVALIDMAIIINPSVDVFFLDTSFLFRETYELRRRLEDRYKIQIRAWQTDITPENQELNFGAALWSRDPDLCCRLRKLEPLRDALRGRTAWITAIRRDQTIERASARAVEWDYQWQLIKVNPLVRWSKQQVLDYVAKHDVPYNPLHDKDYPSIGCTHCTQPVLLGEHERAGRWPGREKRECGMHGAAPPTTFVIQSNLLRPKDAA